jgi:hypothetical protein
MIASLAKPWLLGGGVRRKWLKYLDNSEYCGNELFQRNDPWRRLMNVAGSALARDLHDEIMRQMRHIADWGGKFIVPIPQVELNDSRGLP